MKEALGRLLSHAEWANEQVLGALREGAPPRRALAYFGHVLAVEHLWLSRLLSQSTRYAVWPTLSLEECVTLAQENARALRALLKGSVPGDLERPVTYVNSNGDTFTSLAGDILLHVALHGAYHRGQVAVLVRDGGGEPAPTDYIGYVRGVPAASQRARQPG